MTWADKAGSAILDLGSPTATVATLGEGPDQSGFVGGYSLMEAESTEALQTLLDGHPHLMMQGASIEVCELLPMPGS